MLPYADLLNFRLKEGWWQDRFSVPWNTTCTIKLLMVTDGDTATFGNGNSYDLSRVLQALQHDLPPHVHIDVTTARHHSGPAAPTADINGLNFKGHDLSQYDQIWLFGEKSGTGLRAGEATALWDFMNGGGGVFATGDHEALGEALCARIPRVRSMRRWYYPNPGPNGEPVAPKRNVDDRHGEMDSTTTLAGGENDGVPQTIAPTMYSAHDAFVFVVREYPHPVLCGKGGPITKLPDHMHEGLVEVPADLEMPMQVDGTAIEAEYPRAGADRLAPEVIAHSTINNNPAQGPFGVIGAYDGHLVDEIEGGVGRIVVDATWHHFWNMNVNQFADAHDAVAAAVATGVAPAPGFVAPAQAWEEMRAYFQNIAFWLARRSTQHCVRRRGLWYVVHHVDVQMALKSAQVDRVGHLGDLGRKARDALGHFAPQCERLLMIYEPPTLVEKIPWRIPRPDPPWKSQVPLLDDVLLDDIVLGAQVEAAARETESAQSAEDLDKLLANESFDGSVAKAALEALELLGARLESDAQRLRQLAADVPRGP